MTYLSALGAYWNEYSTRTWTILFCHLSNKIQVVKGNLNRVSFSPVLMLRNNICSHVWRWVIVSSNLVQLFDTICSQYLYQVIYRTITIVYAWLSPCRKGNSHLLGMLSYEKVRRYNNSTPYMPAKMAANTDSLFELLWYLHYRNPGYPGNKLLYSTETQFLRNCDNFLSYY